MKKLYTYLFLTTLSSLSFAQVETEILSINNIDAIVSNNGMLFNNSTMTTAGYEIPSGSGNNAIYTMGFWFGGEDINGNLKLAAQTFTESGDLFAGALTTDGGAEAPAEAESAGVYSILKSEIDYHIENVGEVGYSIPSSILDWPAHGNTDVGIAFHLAPFVDVNGNALYEPEIGDYPKIKGDQAAYLIMNDKAAAHESGGDPIGLEVHYLIYQYISDDYLNNTTFINMRVINRGTQTIYGFKTGCFVDPDLGNGTDDYAGFNVENNVMYAYNGDDFDEAFGGQPGYGDNPPAIGVTLLSQDVHAFVSYDNSIGAYGSPTIPSEFYNYMNAIWKDGSHFTDDVGEETNFLLTGNPNEVDSWSENNLANAPGDRRMMLSADGDILKPFEILCYDYAIVYNRDGNRLENVQGVIDNAALVKTFYDADEDAYCGVGFSRIAELEKTEQLISVFPNPSNGSFTVDAEGEYSLQLFSFDGRLVFEESNKFGQENIQTNLVSGTYLVVITQGLQQSNTKLIIQ